MIAGLSNLVSLATMTAQGIAGFHLVRFELRQTKVIFWTLRWALTTRLWSGRKHDCAHASGHGCSWPSSKEAVFIDPQTIAFQHEVDHLYQPQKSL